MAACAVNTNRGGHNVLKCKLYISVRRWCSYTRFSWRAWQPGWKAGLHWSLVSALLLTARIRFVSLRVNILIDLCRYISDPSNPLFWCFSIYNHTIINANIVFFTIWHLSTSFLWHYYIIIVCICKLKLSSCCDGTVLKRKYVTAFNYIRIC